MTLPVKVSGRDGNGNAFTQTATTRDIAPGGISVAGIGCLGGPGEIVNVEHQQKKARYRVVAIDRTGLIHLEAVEGGRYLFAEHLPAAAFWMTQGDPDPYPTPVAAAPQPAPAAVVADRREGERRGQQERRRHTRYVCVGTVRLRENGSDVAMMGRLNEISLGGCYIETMSPLRCDTHLRLELEVQGRNLRMEGVVRVSQPNFGMGVEFMEMAVPDKNKLAQVIAELGGTPPPPSPEAEPPAAPETAEFDVAAKALADEVVRWFITHDALSRQQFRALVQGVRQHSGEVTHARK